MKYYLVNYIILENKRVTENEYIGVTLYNFASIEGFKQSIADIRHNTADINNIVIKSYKQISQEYYNSLHTNQATA